MLERSNLCLDLALQLSEKLITVLTVWDSDNITQRKIYSLYSQPRISDSKSDRLIKYTILERRSIVASIP